MQFDCIIVYLNCTYMYTVCNNLKCIYGPNETQFQLFGLNF